MTHLELRATDTLGWELRAFLRAGRFDEPVRFDVDVTRDGRSFHARRVEARQSGAVILTMLTSFQHSEPGDDYQIAAFDTRSPDDDAPWVATGMEAGTGGDGPFALVDAQPGPRRDVSLEWSTFLTGPRPERRFPPSISDSRCAMPDDGSSRSSTTGPRCSSHAWGR